MQIRKRLAWLCPKVTVCAYDDDDYFCSRCYDVTGHIQPDIKHIIFIYIG